jgi:diadenosine tetraphosphate (Ap4A) HIT family hydrolase
MFELHERLRNDTFEIGSLGLSRLLLMNDRSFPWLILVPERKGVTELDELSRDDRIGLVEEVALVSGLLRRLYKPDKINIGALGNLVPQLHMHVIGRFRTDRAWPGPVWGSGPAEAYTKEEAVDALARMRDCLRDLSGDRRNET